MKQDIYFPFFKYEQEIHSISSNYYKWQMSNAIYNNLGKACTIPYEQAKQFLKKSIDWMWYLIDAPAEYQHCDFSEFSDLELYFLLRERVELTLITPWQQLTPQYKNMLLAFHPQLAPNVTILQELSKAHWQKILSIKPEYSIYCPWNKLSGDNWQVVLEEHPDFAVHCDFEKLSIENWQELLKKQIRFMCFCPVEIRKNFSNDIKEELFVLYPEIKGVF